MTERKKKKTIKTEYFKPNECLEKLGIVESTLVTDYNFPRFERSELIDISQTQIFK